MQATLSHYRVLEEIGKGGMGVVYRAHDERLDRDVALKVLPAGALADEAARRRFRKEALALSKLSHPNIATVFDFDTQDGTNFLAEELIRGVSLNEMLVSGPLSELEIVNLGAQLCEGLAAAHEQGVIHRDLKPANIRVTPDARVKILDFGLAKILRPAIASDTEATASFTETQQVSGTLPYMAPEQLLNEKLDARTDIWAAGCVLYEMATGRRPFAGSGMALADLILHQQPTNPSKLNHKVNPGLEAIILKCLEKDPALRYASARDIGVDLHRLSTGTVTKALAARQRARALKIGPIVALLLVVAALIVWRLGLRTAGTTVAQPAQVAPSIAVLPFADMSPGKDQEYFSDGLADELLNTLAKIPELRVTARTSSFQFKGKNEDLRVIGERLNVATVLEGSVRKRGNRIRINVELVKVSDGFHLWSESYDRDLKDVFAVQDEIARSVAGSLKVTLLGAKMPSPQATTPEAYSAYLQGRYFQGRGTKEDYGKAIAYYQEAIKLDAKYALAWAALADARSSRASYFMPWPELRDEMNKARGEAHRALALAPTLAQAHAVLGRIKMESDLDWAGADASYQQALALDPGQAVVVLNAGDLAATLGRFDEASRLYQRAVELDPLNVRAYLHTGRESLWAGHPENAEAAARKALEINPGAPSAHSLTSMAYIAESRPQEALAEAEREPDPLFHLQTLALAYYALARKQESDRALAELIAKYETQGPIQIAQIYAFRGEADKAFDWLERSYAYHDTALGYVKTAPQFKNLRNDPRYAAFMKKIHLPLN